jgi:hypothetical protein
MVFKFFLLAVGMAQVVECLPSKSAALSSNPSTANIVLFVFFFNFYHLD